MNIIKELKTKYFAVIQLNKRKEKRKEKEKEKKEQNKYILFNDALNTFL